MDSTSPIAARIAGQTSGHSGSLKFSCAMGLFTLVGNTFAGRWRADGAALDADDGHRRYREYHHRSADGHGRAS